MRAAAKINLSGAAVIIIAAVAMINFMEMHLWKQNNRIIAWDVISYYAYLPATFIYDDITLDFTRGRDEFSDKFWPQTTEDGSLVIKTTMGVAWFYTPWFIAGHITARLSGYEANGFTEPYRFFLQLGGIVIMIISLIMLRNLLLTWFSDRVTAVTLILLTFATNLYYYGTIESTYSHIYSFFLIILFIRETARFYRNPSPLTPALIGITAGLATLIRPTNIIIIIIFLLWEVKNLDGITARIRILLSGYRSVIIIILFFILPWIPQLLYWKEITGQWFYYSYLDEKFFFGHPHLAKGLFGFRKGLFIYAPVLLAAWTGIFFMKEQLKNARLVLIIFTLVNTYIIFSWWCWWYGGSYGQRAFVDTLGLYAIPMAAFVALIPRLRKSLRYIVSTLLLIILLQGIFQTFQYYYGAIHWDSMTRAAWVDSLGRLKPSERFGSLLEEPDYEKAKATGRE